MKERPGETAVSPFLYVKMKEEKEGDSVKKSRIHLLLLGLLFVLGGCGQATEPSDQTNKDSPNQPIAISVAAQHVAATEIEATIRLKNPNDRTVSVTYPSSQKFELVVRDSNGENVYTYSKEQVFTQAIETEQFKPEEEKEYQVTIELAAGDTARRVEVATVKQFDGATEPSTKATANISKANP